MCLLRKEGRATLFDDSQYLGEKSPYYNSPPKSGNEKDDKFGKYGKLFFPDVIEILFSENKNLFF